MQVVMSGAIPRSVCLAVLGIDGQSTNTTLPQSKRVWNKSNAVIRLVNTKSKFSLQNSGLVL
jgi:hypothetical protein